MKQNIEDKKDKQINELKQEIKKLKAKPKGAEKDSSIRGESRLESKLKTSDGSIRPSETPLVEKDREALIRGYLDDIKEGNISIEDALDSIMCVAEQKTAERIFIDVVKYYLCENSQGKARKVSGKKVDRVRSYMPARLCSHGQDDYSVSPQDGNSALGDAYTRKSEKRSAEDLKKTEEE